MTTKSKQAPTVEAVQNPDADAFLSAAVERQDLALKQLETRLDELGDDFAARVRTMVERGLMAARSKALQEIKTIDVSFFLQTDRETLHGSEQLLITPQDVNQ